MGEPYTLHKLLNCSRFGLLNHNTKTIVGKTQFVILFTRNEEYNKQYFVVIQIAQLVLHTPNF